MDTASSSAPILENHYSRREFVFDTIKGLGFIAVGTFSIQFLASCTTSSPTEPTNNDEIDDGSNELIITIDLTLQQNQALAMIGGAIALEANILDEKGLLVIREGATSVKAFSRECTHNQCQTGAFQNGVSECPCHGSRYDSNGQVIQGPAPDPLKQYNAELSGNIITIS